MNLRQELQAIQDLLSEVLSALDEHEAETPVPEVTGAPSGQKEFHFGRPM